MTTALESEAYVALLDHGTTCPTCTAVDEGGKNLGLPCKAGARILQAYRQTLRGPAVASRNGG